MANPVLTKINIKDENGNSKGTAEFGVYANNVYLDSEDSSTTLATKISAWNTAATIADNINQGEAALQVGSCTGNVLKATQKIEIGSGSQPPFLTSATDNKILTLSEDATLQVTNLESKTQVIIGEGGVITAPSAGRMSASGFWKFPNGIALVFNNDADSKNPGIDFYDANDGNAWCGHLWKSGKDTIQLVIGHRPVGEDSIQSTIKNLVITGLGSNTLGGGSWNIPSETAFTCHGVSWDNIVSRIKSLEDQVAALTT